MKDWQTLEAGGLAILAAIIGAIALNRQTRTTRNLEEDRRTRRLRAVRSVLPLTLSSLSDWADECGLLLLRPYSNGAAHLPELPTVPTNAIPNLEQLVEAGSKAAAESVSNLLGDIQIFSARLAQPSNRGRLGAASDFESHLIGIGTIAAHIGALFDFSRRRSESTPARPTWDQVREALRLMHADVDLHPGIFERIDERQRSGRKPGYDESLLNHQIPNA